jgi:hypothetical protein
VPNDRKKCSGCDRATLEVYSAEFYEKKQLASRWHMVHVASYGAWPGQLQMHLTAALGSVGIGAYALGLVRGVNIMTAAVGSTPKELEAYLNLHVVRVQLRPCLQVAQPLVLEPLDDLPINREQFHECSQIEVCSLWKSVEVCGSLRVGTR